MGWKFDFKPKAEKQLKKLDKDSQQLIRSYLKDKVLKLTHPFLLGKALTGNFKGLWRYRVDKFRIICQLQEDKLTVLIVKISKRNEIYYA